MAMLSITLLLDKEKKRVVFAEVCSDFIDILFSFLTLPLGTIMRLLGKQIGLGCLDNIYKSVEQFDAKDLLQIEACKEILLNPRSSTSSICENLKIKYNVHDDDPRRFYVCNETDCLTHSICYYTYLQNIRCSRCGKYMDKVLSWLIGSSENESVFIRLGTNIIVTDDLRVIPLFLKNGFSIVKELGIKDASILEKKVVDVSHEEVLNLLRRSLVSENVLIEVYFPNECMEQNMKRCSIIKDDIEWSKAPPNINVKIILNKKSNKILYAQVGGDFLDQLLSFLTFPLISVFKLLDDHMSLMGGITNLYSSAKNLSLDWFQSEECKNMVISPKLPPYYVCTNRILDLDDIKSLSWTCSTGYVKCFTDIIGSKSCMTSPYKHELREAELVEQYPDATKYDDFDEYFQEDLKSFMVADNLCISHLSAISFIEGIGCPISDLIEKEVSVGSAEIKMLLRAMLTSQTVLTDVFSKRQ